MVDQEPLACRADHHRHPLSYVEGTEAARERMECLFCADPVPPGTAEDTESRLASKVTCRDVDWQGTAALLAVEADGGLLRHAYRAGDHSCASCRRRRTASPPRAWIWSRGPTTTSSTRARDRPV